MARLTILQASQQGFGSTLTIHRHIKDGSLPTYEEGDTKLLDVDDLIALFGEPGGGVKREEGGESGSSEIDVYEYNRMKSELDQKNKKNMWLAADLAEVVREMKEKEAKFEAERDRLLKVLEQAQALLLREAQRAGSPLKNADGSVLTLDQIAPGLSSEPETASTQPASSQNGAAGTGEAPDNAPLMPEIEPEEVLPQSSLEPELLSSGKDDPPDAGKASEPPLSEQMSALNEFASETKADEANSLDIGEIPREAASKTEESNEPEPVNPLIPPLEAQRNEPESNRFLGTTTWLLLLTLVGGGFVFFEFRTQVMASIAKITKILGGA